MSAAILSETLPSASPLAWDASMLLARSDWRLEFPISIVEEFVNHLAHRPDSLKNVDSFAFSPKDLPLQAALGRRIRAGLLSQSGVCWLQGLAKFNLSEHEQRLLYLSLGMSMGQVMTEYGRLYPVRDRGVDYTTEAVPVSMTSAATGLHTDSSSVDACPDFIALLCEKQSLRGGASLLSNALKAYDQLQTIDPSAVKILESDFIRDVVTPGRSRSSQDLLRNRFPIFAPSPRRGGEDLRYMRYWIEKGQERAQRPLISAEIAALDLLDEILESTKNLVSIDLVKGDMLWINNRKLVHGRSEYQDSPANPRQLQRLWLRDKG